MDSNVRTACEQGKLTRSHYRFSRKTVRAWCGWSDTQVRVHLDRLVQLEYVLTHRGGRGQSFEYELLYDGEGEQGAAFMMGLLDIENLQTAKTTTMTESSRGEMPRFAGSKRPQNGGSADRQNPLQSSNGKALQQNIAQNTKSTSGGLDAIPSYRSDTFSLVAQA
jgi:hypothetical protein